MLGKDAEKVRTIPPQVQPQSASFPKPLVLKARIHCSIQPTRCLFSGQLSSPRKTPSTPVRLKNLPGRVNQYQLFTYQGHNSKEAIAAVKIPGAEIACLLCSPGNWPKYGNTRIPVSDGSYVGLCPFLYCLVNKQQVVLYIYMHSIITVLLLLCYQ